MAIRSFFYSFRRLSFFVVLFLTLALAGELQAAIVFKVMVMNPSKDQVQKASVKQYLPKEAKPEDIINMGDLDIAYDTQQGCYYVFGEFDLKPGEVMAQDIELRDIWLVPSEELEGLRKEMAKIADLLKNTDYAERVNFLKTSVDSKINQIMEAQKNPAANPEKHISDYRDSLKVMESVRSDLVLARGFLTQVSPLSSAVVWKLILGIVIFLGIMSASFYFIWQSQIKPAVREEPYLEPKEGASGPKGPERHEPKKE